MKSMLLYCAVCLLSLTTFALTKGDYRVADYGYGASTISHVQGWSLTRPLTIDVSPIDVTNESYSIECRVLYHDRNSERPSEDGEWDRYAFDAAQVNEWLEDFVLERYANLERNQILFQCNNKDLAYDIQDNFPKYAANCAKALNSELPADKQIEINVYTVDVRPVGQLLEAIKKLSPQLEVAVDSEK